MNLSIILIIASFWNLCLAVVLNLRKCTGHSNKLEVEKIDAFYDKGETNLVYYALQLRIVDPFYNITLLNKTTNSYLTFHILVAYLNGTTHNWYYSFCDFTSKAPYIGNFSNEIDFNSLSGYNEYHNVSSVCPIYHNVSNFFFLNYVQHLGDFPDITSYDIQFSFISNDGTDEVLGCIIASVTPLFDISFTTSIITVFSILLFVMIAIDYVSLNMSPFNESKYDCFLNYVSAICNAPFLNHMAYVSYDYLQYLQFAFFNGGLNILYPGFYKPILMYFNWCTLMTYDLFSSSSSYNVQDVDNLYSNGFNDGLSGLTDFTPDNFKQFGWRVFIVWSLFVVGVVIGISIFSIVLCWLYQVNKKSQPFKSFLNGFWKKCLYYLLGGILRVYYVLFALPFLVLSLYQFNLFVNHDFRINPAASIIGFLLILLWVFFLFGFFTKYIILTDNVRSKFKYLKNLNNNHFNSKNLYVSVKVINLFGFMYYKYRPNRTNFVFYSYSLLFLQAIVISCIQKSGTVQVFLTIAIQLFHLFLLFSMHPHYFEPKKNSGSNNNSKHRNKNPILPRNMPFYLDVFVSTFKLIIVLLNIAYIPAINASERNRSYVGYVQLCLHLVVIAFFLFRSLFLSLDLLISIQIARSKSKAIKTSTSEVKHIKLLSHLKSNRKLLLNNTEKKFGASIDDADGSVDLQSPSDLYFRNAVSAYSPQFDSNMDSSTQFFENNDLENKDVITASEVAETLSYCQVPTDDNLDETSNNISDDTTQRQKQIDTNYSEPQSSASGMPYILSNPSRGTEYYSIREADLYRSSILNNVDDYDSSDVINPDSEIKDIWNKREQSANPMKAENYLEDPSEDNPEEDKGLNLGRFLQKMKWKNNKNFYNNSGSFQNIRFSNLSLKKKSHNLQLCDYSYSGCESVLSSPKSNASGFHVSRPRQLIVKTLDDVQNNKLSLPQTYRQKQELGQIPEDENDFIEIDDSLYVKKQRSSKFSTIENLIYDNPEEE